MGRGEQPAVVWQWLRGMAHLSIVVVFVLTAVGYAPVREPAARPGKAGQPLNPVATAAHIAAARVDAMTGDVAGAKAHVDAIARRVRSRPGSR